MQTNKTPIFSLLSIIYTIPNQDIHYFHDLAYFIFPKTQYGENSGCPEISDLNLSQSANYKHNPILAESL